MIATPGLLFPQTNAGRVISLALTDVAVLAANPMPLASTGS